MLAYRCVPVSLLHDATFSKLTSFERDVVWCSQLGQDSRHGLPYDPAMLRSVLMPGRPFVALKEIANARDRLVALGVFLHRRGAKKEWLELAPDYRHVAGTSETVYGETPPKQEELAFPQADKPAVPRTRSAVRIDKNRTNNDSRAKAPESGSRDAGAVGDFGRSESDFLKASPLTPENCTRTFWRALSSNPEECQQRGALWVARWKKDAQRLYACASDFLAMPADKQKTSNFAAMATKCFREHNPDAI
ncbi:MAG: hypothetical protein EBT64_07610 [Gammaproteobacteria bacterium]|nr:hypothetical protein [Gammaproteobacteria bacterium]